MPPITDPQMLAQIAAQQQPNPQPQPFPGPSIAPLPPLSNRMGRKTDIDTAATQQSTNFSADLHPYTVRKAAADATKAEADATKAQKDAGDDTFNPAQVDFYASQVLAGQTPQQVIPGWGKNPNRMAVMKAVADKAIQMGMPGAGLATLQQHYKAIGGRINKLEAMRGMVLQSEQTALANLKQFIDASSRVPGQTGSGLVNSVINQAVKSVDAPGGTDVSAMRTAHQVAATETAKVLQNTPTGAGVLSDSARHEAMAVIESNAPMDQKMASYEVLKQDMANRVKALDDGIALSYKDLTKLPEVEQSIGVDINPDTMQGTKTISHDLQPIHVPKSYQNAHAQFMVQHKPGTLTTKDYVEFRHALDEQYGFLGENGITSKLDPATVHEFVKQYNEGKINPNAPVPTPTVPSNLLQKAATSGPGVAAANFTNAITASAPELLSGQEGRDAFHIVNEQHPVAAMTGDIAGSVVPIAGAEAGAAKIGEKIFEKGFNYSRRKIATDAAANALYQGVRGFNDANDGEGLGGAVEGAILGGVAGPAAHFVTGGIKPFLADATKEALDQLKAVPLTTLQRIGAGKAEEMLKGVPLIRGARQTATQGFKRDLASQILDAIPDTIPGIRKDIPKAVGAGTKLNQFVHDQANTAYNTIKPQIQGVTDPAYNNAQAALLAQAKAKTGLGGMRELKEALGMFAGTGKYDGQGYQNASERLRALQLDYGNIAEQGGKDKITASAARDMVKVLENARNQIRAQVGRNDPVTGAKLKGVEKAWALKMRFDDATNRAVAGTEGEISPQQYITSIKKLDTSANKNMTARGQGLNQKYAEAAAKVMGSQGAPQAGSLKETGITAAMLGLGSAGGAGLAALGGGSAAVGASVIPNIAATLGLSLYAPGFKQLTRAALLKRPSADNVIAKELIKKYPNLGPAIIASPRQALTEALSRYLMPEGKQ